MVVVAGAMVVTGAADVDGTDDSRSNVSQLAVWVCGTGAVAVVGAGGWNCRRCCCAAAAGGGRGGRCGGRALLLALGEIGRAHV